jgi:hypothetical protein
MNTTKYVTVLQDVSSKLFLTAPNARWRTRIDTLAHARTFRSGCDAVKEAKRLNRKIKLKDQNLKKHYVVRFVPLSRFVASRVRSRSL